MDAGHPPGSGALDALVDGWDGERCRLLCEPVTGAAGDGRAGRADFQAADGTPVRYVGSCLLPSALVERLSPVPSGLWEVLWRDLSAAGHLDLAVVPAAPGARGVVGGVGGGVVDCGTPADYLRANLLATGGASAISPGAVVLGRVERCVVWPDAVVEADESLVDVVRAGTADAPVTVPAGPHPRRGPGTP